MSSIFGMTASGEGTSQRISITTGIQLGTLSQVHSFDKPEITGIRSNNHPTIGGFFIRTLGSAFGLMDVSPALRISSRMESSANSTYLGQAPTCGSATVSTKWVSETSVLSRSARGYFSSASMTVTAVLQASSISDTFSFDRPDQIKPNPPNAPTRGQGATIDSQGENFGWIDFCANVRVGGTSCEKSIWASDSVIKCGVSAGPPLIIAHNLILTILGRESSTCMECFSFDIPSVKLLQYPNQPTTGNSELTIRGVNFGSIQDYSGSVRLGLSSSEVSVWTSDSQIQCTVAAGVSGLLPIILTFDSRVSTRSMAYTYGRPQVLDISRLYSSPSGGDEVSISGRNFGSADYSPIAFVDYEPCVRTIWTSDSSLSCVVPRGYGPGRGVAVGVSQEVGKAAIIFEYIGQHVLDASGIPLYDHEFLKTWLDSGTLDLDEGSEVHLWKDMSVADNPALGINGPVFVQAQINGLPAVPEPFSALAVIFCLKFDYFSLQLISNDSRCVYCRTHHRP